MNIDKIEVQNNDKEFTIYPKKQSVEIENKIYYIEKESIEELIRIIRVWDNEYIDNSYTDGINFCVKVHYDGKVDVMKGRRAVPDNYEDFNKYVKKIYDRR